jgi:hypothetical protein
VGFGTHPGGLQKSGGEGFDGKVYASYGLCDQEILISDAVFVSGDFSQASVIREKCQDLNTPRPLPIGNLKFAKTDQSVFAWMGKVFDLQSNSAPQKITLSICDSNAATPAVQNLIWNTLDGSGNLFGSVTLDNGKTSGALSLQTPTTRYHYVTKAGQASQFDINLSGALSYAIAGGPLTSVLSTTCATQPPPLTPNFAAYPDATNTGVPANVTLVASPGNLTVNTPGTIIDGLNITGNLTINANNVTVKNSRITSSSGTIVIKIAGGVTGTVIQDCELDALGSGGGGLEGSGTFLRNNIHGAAVAMMVTADSLIQDNYIHGVSGPGSSFDAIRADYGYSNLVIRHNTIINEQAANAAIMLDSYYGTTTGALVEDNRMLGGGYTIYVDSSTYPLSGVTVRNNRMGKGSFGYKDIRGNTPVWTGNIDDITGALIP